MSNDNDVFQSPCVFAHVQALKDAPKSYIHQLAFLLESGTFSVVPGSVRSSILVALHATSQHKALAQVLQHCEVTDIAKAATALDRSRAARQLARKIQDIQNAHPHLISTTSESGEHSSAKRKGKIDIYRRKLRVMEATEWCNCTDSTCHNDTAVQEILDSAPGVSGAFARKVKQWAKTTLSSDALEFIMLTMPNKSVWKNLADLVHFAPADFAVPYFLSDVFDETIPEDSFVARMRHMVQFDDTTHMAHAFKNIANKFPQVYLAYAFLRLHPLVLRSKSVVEDLASKIPLDTAIWYFEELYQHSKNCDDIVRDRLKNEQLARSSKTRTYGKLLERILTFRRMKLCSLSDSLVSVADQRLEELEGYWKEQLQNKRVAVLGDASASMQRAIEAATIFSSLVSVCLDADLTFFNNVVIPCEKPRNVREVLKVCHKIRANNCTSLAAALWEYLSPPKHIDMFVLVTDEEENTPFRNLKFAESFAKYQSEVNPDAKLVVVSVGSGDRLFQSSLAKHKIDYKRVVIDGSRPDLAKFDALLGQLAMMVTDSVVGDTSDACADVGNDDFVLVS